MEDKLKEFAKQQGADVVGIAAPDAIPDYFPRRKLEEILPGAKAVIVFGVRMLWGSIKSPSSRVATTHTNGAYEELHSITYRIGRHLENQGYLAACIAPHIPVEMSKETKGLSGDISLRHAGVGAGLGVLGRSGLLLTPEFGPRVRLAAVVTDTPLRGDAVLHDDPCGDCEACLANCPSGALTENGTDITTCFFNIQPYGLGKYIQWLKNINPGSREDWQKAVKSTDFWNFYQAQALGLYYECFECLINCPAGKR